MSSRNETLDLSSPTVRPSQKARRRIIKQKKQRTLQMVLALPTTRGSTGVWPLVWIEMLGLD
jgi:hypothetical protein